MRSRIKEGRRQKPDTHIPGGTRDQRSLQFLVAPGAPWVSFVYPVRKATSFACLLGRYWLKRWRGWRFVA